MTRTSIFQAIRGRETTPDSSTAVAVAAPVFKPTYEEKLRLIGMHFDNHQMSTIKLLEVPGGFLARVAGPHGDEELLEFPDTLFPTLFEQAVALRGTLRETDPLRLKSELIPTSYADVLRAIGGGLDLSLARSILISEGPGSIYLSGLRLENSSMRSTLAPFDQVLFPEDIDRALDEAYLRRSQPN